MKIENAKDIFFENKEHYLQFRQAWKDYINAGEAKPIEQVYFYSGEVFLASQLTCKHHLIYNLLRGKDTNEMFKLTNKVHGQQPWFPFYDARSEIALTLRLAEKSDVSVEWQERYRKRLEELLAPFVDTLSIEMLEKFIDIIKDWKLPVEAAQ
jgi:hypothetical protein